MTFAKSLAARLFHDQHGFIVSAELVLVATIAVLAMVVGLSEVALNVNHELEDVASAFGSLNQSFHVQGQRGCKSFAAGSCYHDQADNCDSQGDISCGPAQGEG